MILQEDDLSFDFSGAISATKFDDTDCHDLSHCMKAVDFVVDLNNSTLFVEVKDPSNPRATTGTRAEFERRLTSEELRNQLVTKFRDSYLYQWASKKTDKPHHYICLITLEEALLLPFMDKMKQHLPVGLASSSWMQPLAASVQVLNLEGWNRNFTQWPVFRISDVTIDDPAKG